jgi:hypothetical protein
MGYKINEEIQYESKVISAFSLLLLWAYFSHFHDCFASRSSMLIFIVLLLFILANLLLPLVVIMIIDVMSLSK